MLTLILALAACGGENENGEAGDSAVTTADTAAGAVETSGDGAADDGQSGNGGSYPSGAELPIIWN